MTQHQPAEREFTARARPVERNKITIPIPFDPHDEWGAKAVHHVHGTVNGIDVRAVLDELESGWSFTLGPAWGGARALDLAEPVHVLLRPEGPQRQNLAEDIQAALDANPAAGAFFDSLAQYYRTGYLRWIDATKRRPDERVARIDKMITLLEARKKQRP